MTELWIASGNPKKRGELERLLGPLGYRLRLQSELDAPPQVVEDAPDFAGNAEKKAVALAIAVEALAIGDDSGLCVDALDGRPGVHSARYAGEGANDADRVEKLLGELAQTPESARGAHFVCHLCLAGPGGRVLERVEASCGGRIGEHPRGEGGFGYDPVFVPDELPSELAGATPKPTFAELSAEQKDAISHRGLALRQLADRLRRHPAVGR